MALLTSAFLSRFPDAVMNIHPSLLPAFPGVRAVEQAIAYGVKVFGVTVHFVLDDGGVDTGPVIVQRAIEVADPTDADAVREALRPVEHALLPEAVRLIARGAVARDPDHPRRTVVTADDTPARRAPRVGFPSVSTIGERARVRLPSASPTSGSATRPPPYVPSTKTESPCAACWRCRSSPS